MQESSNSRDTMSNFVVFDTSIFIDHLRTGRHQQRIAATTGLVRNSAVVLAELSRGASKPAEREFVERLALNHPILTPAENNWLESDGESKSFDNLSLGRLARSPAEL